MRARRAGSKKTRQTRVWSHSTRVPRVQTRIWRVFNIKNAPNACLNTYEGVGGPVRAREGPAVTRKRVLGCPDRLGGLSGLGGQGLGLGLGGLGLGGSGLVWAVKV